MDGKDFIIDYTTSLFITAVDMYLRRTLKGSKDFKNLHDFVKSIISKIPNIDTADRESLFDCFILKRYTGERG